MKNVLKFPKHSLPIQHLYQIERTKQKQEREKDIEHGDLHDTSKSGKTHKTKIL